ncbi:hypothetical protein [Salipiger marinus]|uniref:Uncharacterized protein n=1 Tax=Salipiger marinus TaxID=555512 RepID=A0A1G8PXL8_9RHOB|nr:hypothetical protein [Salipiger marinus]SDI96580.1 hypothetical protein SAMN04487993_1013149 [Salipiger marinus]
MTSLTKDANRAAVERLIQCASKSVAAFAELDIRLDETTAAMREAAQIMSQRRKG